EFKYPFCVSNFVKGRRVMKAVLTGLALLVCGGVASANVSVSGTGKVVYVPDLGYISVGVVSEGKTAREAWDKNRAKVEKIFAVLKKMGLAEKDYQTSGLNISPKYVYHTGQEPELVGYVASYDLKVTVRKLGQMGEVLDGVVEAGANRKMNIAFSSSQ